MIRRFLMRRSYNKGQWSQARTHANKIIHLPKEKELARSVVIRSYFNEGLFAEVIHCNQKWGFEFEHLSEKAAYKLSLLNPESKKVLDPRIKNLHASIDGKEILKGLNLEVKPGEVHAIMGPNGSGKSTLASVIAGKEDYEVTDGEIFFDLPASEYMMGIMVDMPIPAIKQPIIMIYSFVVINVMSRPRLISIPFKVKIFFIENNLVT